MMNGQRTLEKEGVNPPPPPPVFYSSQLYIFSYLFLLLHLLAGKTSVYCFAFWSHRGRPSGSMFSGVALHEIFLAFYSRGSRRVRRNGLEWHSGFMSSGVICVS